MDEEQVATLPASECDHNPEPSSANTSDIKKSSSPSQGNSFSASERDFFPGKPNWMRNPLFNWYWKHYNMAWEWYKYHCRLTGGANKHMIFKLPPELECRGEVRKRGESSGSHRASSSTPSKPSKRAKRRAKSKRLKRRQMVIEAASQAQEGSDVEGEEDNMDVEEGEEFFQMEITPEMLEFFQQSAKHKKERDCAKRKKNESESSIDYIDLGEASSGATKASKAPPSERPGVKRTEQMRDLYGGGAAMIHGMETAIQLNFDRNCDIKTPRHWPHLPLNIIFQS